MHVQTGWGRGDGAPGLAEKECFPGVSSGVSWFCRMVRQCARCCAEGNPPNPHGYRGFSLSVSRLFCRARPCKMASGAL